MPSCIRSPLRFIFGSLKGMTESSVVLGIGGLGKDWNLEGHFSSLSHRKSDADNRQRYWLFSSALSSYSMSFVFFLQEEVLSLLSLGS